MKAGDFMKAGDRFKCTKRLDLLFITYNEGEIFTLSQFGDGSMGIYDDHLSLTLVHPDGSPDPLLSAHFKKVIRLRSA